MAISHPFDDHLLLSITHQVDGRYQSSYHTVIFRNVIYNLVYYRRSNTSNVNNCRWLSNEQRWNSQIEIFIGVRNRAHYSRNSHHVRRLSISNIWICPAMITDLLKSSVYSLRFSDKTHGDSISARRTGIDLQAQVYIKLINWPDSSV